VSARIVDSVKTSRVWSAVRLQMPLAVLGLLGTAVAIDSLALATASGVVLVDPPFGQEIDYINHWWWLASLVLAWPLWLFGRRWPRALPCLLAAVAVSAPQFWAFDVELARWDASGFSSGLERFDFVVPMLISVFVVGAVGVGAAAGRRGQPGRPHERRSRATA
jgi:hypothetical protein